MKNLKYIYLDDLRTPVCDIWTIVRNYVEFTKTIESIGLENIETISLDHDLGLSEFEDEKTGYDCAKYLVEISINTKIKLPQIFVHSSNPVGSLNIIKYVNNYLHFCKLPETCDIINIKFKL
jgi:hypothetical protein